MEECCQMQLEELQVLRAIYEGDAAFVELSEAGSFQYKVGVDGGARSFLVQVSWPPLYPLSDLPVVTLDAFYNGHISEDDKRRIVDEVLTQARSMLGMSMTYTLFEWLKDNGPRLTEDMCSGDRVTTKLSDLSVAEEDEKTVQSTRAEATDRPATAAAVVKKEHMSKQQKRRAWDRVQSGATGSMSDRPRGWNWVDIVRHLSQTGQQS